MTFDPVTTKRLEQADMASPSVSSLPTAPEQRGEADIMALTDHVSHTHPDFTPEELEACLVYLSLKQRRAEVYRRLANS